MEIYLTKDHRVYVALQGVQLMLDFFVIKQVVLVVLYHRVLKMMVVPRTLQHVCAADEQNVLKNLACIVTEQAAVLELVIKLLIQLHIH